MRTLEQIEKEESCDHQTARVIQKMEALSDSGQATGSICEWQLTSTTPYEYEPSCGATKWHTMDDHYGFDDSPEFKFCPYCGNKIKYK